MQTRFYILSLLSILLASATLLLVGSRLCYTSTIDTATFGLMSVNILHGERPLFFYGQTYFGSIEAYLSAFYIFLFGFSEFVVSLAPISFTLGWVIFTCLFFTRLYNRTTGIIAATCTAFPGYYVFWYSIGTYGYSVISCVGTAILWLSLRMLQQNDRDFILILQGIILGLLAAICIWTHPLTFPFLLIATCLLTVFVFRERFRTDILITLFVAILIALLGFFPLYHETGSIFDEFSKRTQLSWSSISDALSTLFLTNIYELMVWNFRHIFKEQTVRFIVEFWSVGILFSAFILSLFPLLVSRSNVFRFRRFLIPLSYCLLFLMMFVQHQMGTIKAPRYAISFYSILLCTIWSIAIAGQSKPALKNLSIILFCSWIGFQIAGTGLFITNNIKSARIEQKNMRDVVDAARRSKLKSVVTYGDHRLGYKAQKLSMYADNTVVFAHYDHERYQANAQFAEIDLQRGYLTNKSFKKPLEKKLHELGASYSIEQINKYYLFSDIMIKPQYTMRSISSDQIQVRIRSKENGWDQMNQLGDLNQDPNGTLKAISGESISFDIGTVKPVCGIWMFTAQDRHRTHWKGFGHYEVYVSLDDVSYKKVYESQTLTGSVYHSGPQLFIGGLFGKGEILFNPVQSRYIKIHFTQGNLLPITEIMIFETDNSLRQGDNDDINALVQQVKNQNLDFVLGDRWVSAELLEKFRGSEKPKIALPRHSKTSNSFPLLYIVKPKEGQALVCDASVANKCEKILIEEYGKAVIEKRIDFNNYTLFSLANADKSIHSTNRAELLWNGHFPLRTEELMLFIKTKGVYHDSWTTGKGIYYGLDYKIDHGRHKDLIINTYGWRPGKNFHNLQLRVLANNKKLLPFKESKANSYIFSLPTSLDKIESLTVESSTFVPASLDNRILGLDVKGIEIR